MVYDRLSAIAVENRILSGLPEADIDRLAAKLEPIALCSGDILFDPGDPLQFVYFPLTGAVTILSVMEDGESVEVATVGNEGMVGLRAFFGMETALGRAVGQCAGDILRLSVPSFREELRRSEYFYLMVNRYSNALLSQMFHSAGCNRLHSSEQRCARWLLDARDRCRSDEFKITQEFLAAVLGVRRQSVGLMEENLQQAGLISYSRGKVRILDRRGLEAVACECYKRVKAEFDRLG
jgi:CRP-like cAMP-binding protein